MYSNVILVGRLTADPEIRHTSGGVPVANFTVAVNRPYNNGDGEKITDFVRVVTWRGLAENVARNLTKGRLVLVEGNIEISEYEKDNVKYRNPLVNASNVRFLDWPENTGIKNNTDNDDYCDEIDEDFDDDFHFDEYDVPF